MPNERTYLYVIYLQMIFVSYFHIDIKMKLFSVILCNLSAEAPKYVSLLFIL